MLVQRSAQKRTTEIPKGVLRTIERPYRRTGVGRIAKSSPTMRNSYPERASHVGGVRVRSFSNLTTRRWRYCRKSVARAGKLCYIVGDRRSVCPGDRLQYAERDSPETRTTELNEPSCGFDVFHRCNTESGRECLASEMNNIEQFTCPCHALCGKNAIRFDCS